MLFVFLFIFINILIIKNIDYISKKINLYDKPNETRKKHIKHMPVLGGLIIYLNIIFFSFLFLILNLDNTFINFYFFQIKLIFFSNNFEFFLFLFFSTLFFFTGIYDDKYNTFSLKKLLIDFVLLFTLLTLDPNLIISNIHLSSLNTIINFSVFSKIVTIIAIIVFMNSYNMLDGYNLLVGSYTLLLFIYLFGVLPSFFIIIILFGILAYIYLNSQNKIFLGNSGSNLVSFILSIFFIKSYSLGVIESEKIILLMLVPILDLIRLFIFRTKEKKSPFKADREHLHHYVFSQFSTKKSLLIMLLIIYFPFILSFFIANYYSFILSVLLYFGIIIYLKSLKY